MRIFVSIICLLQYVFNLGHDFFSHRVLVKIGQSDRQVGISQELVADCRAPITCLILSILFLFHDWLNAKDDADGLEHEFDCLGRMIKRSHLEHFLFDNSACVIFCLLNCRFNLLNCLFSVISQLACLYLILLTLHFVFLKTFALNFQLLEFFFYVDDHFDQLSLLFLQLRSLRFKLIVRIFHRLYRFLQLC